MRILEVERCCPAECPCFTEYIMSWPTKYYCSLTQERVRPLATFPKNCPLKKVKKLATTCCRKDNDET